jgi:hypothetical protein
MSALTFIDPAYGVLPQDPGSASCAMGLTLADCVPWLEVAVECIDRGPEGLSIEAVERYRNNLLEIIQHVRSALVREATFAPTH